MTLPMMVLPLAGGSPSSVLVIVFSDAVMLVYGDCDDEGFLKVDRGNYRRFPFEQYPFLRDIDAGGALKLNALNKLLERP